MTSPTPVPSWVGLTALVVPLALALGVLTWRRLGQGWPLVIATLRMVGQLLLLGLVLRWVFEHDSPWLVTAVALVMLAISATTVNQRQRRGSLAMRLEVLGALTVSALLVMAIATKIALGVAPWYRGEVVIPLLGMLLGNSINGVSLAAERLDRELHEGRHTIERRLALGASARQAAHEPLRASIGAALTPTINGMSIAGIVAIPGMMTGQLLAGTDVWVALRYQILIYLSIAGVVSLSTLLVLWLRLRRYFNACDQLRPDLPSGRSRN